MLPVRTAMTLVRLEAEQRRTLRRGVRPSRRIDFAPTMAAMRDRGLDPHGAPLELVFGPAPGLGADGSLLDRFVSHVADSAPVIEVEAEPLPGQLPRLSGARPSHAERATMPPVRAARSVVREARAASGGAGRNR